MATTKTNSTAKASKVSEGIEIVDGYIVITLPLNKKPSPSASGKTFTLASTGGFTWSDELDYMDFDTIGVSVNVNGKK